MYKVEKQIKKKQQQLIAYYFLAKKTYESYDFLTKKIIVYQQKSPFNNSLDLILKKITPSNPSK